MPRPEAIAVRDPPGLPFENIGGGRARQFGRQSERRQERHRDEGGGTPEQSAPRVDRRALEHHQPEQDQRDADADDEIGERGEGHPLRTVGRRPFLRFLGADGRIVMRARRRGVSMVMGRGGSAPPSNSSAWRISGSVVTNWSAVIDKARGDARAEGAVDESS